jgi:hypothetical protein
MEKIHIKQFGNTSFIGSWDLMNNDETFHDLTVTITKIGECEVYNQQKKEKEMVKTIHLHGQLPMILNSTNVKTLTQLFGTGLISNWIGKTFTLYVKKIIVGKTPTDALRIRDILPIIKLPIFTQLSPKWNDAITALKSGKTTIDEMRKTREISIETEKILKDEVSK